MSGTHQHSPNTMAYAQYPMINSKLSLPPKFFQACRVQVIQSIYAKYLFLVDVAKYPQ